MLSVLIFLLLVCALFLIKAPRPRCPLPEEEDQNAAYRNPMNLKENSMPLPDPAVPASVIEKRKVDTGSLIAIAWFVSGLYLFATTPGANFLSFPAALYFLVGTFGSPIVLGALSYAVKAATERSLAVPGWRMGVLNIIALAMLAFETVGVFLIAREVVRMLHSGIAR